MCNLPACVCTLSTFDFCFAFAQSRRSVFGLKLCGRFSGFRAPAQNQHLIAVCIFGFICGHSFGRSWFVLHVDVCNQTWFGGWGWKRSEAETPTGNPSPAPTHPHRTHDTTDQWREVVQWLGRFWRKVWLCGSPPRPTSNSHHRCYVLETTVITMVSLSPWKAHGSNC